MKEEGADVELYYTQKLRIKPCQGEFHCWEKTPGKCFQDDDMSELYPKIHSADVVAFATPMPGVIVNILVREGDTAEEGDPIVILEAMKVENTLTAPSGGKVISINCNIADSVKKGDLLVQIN